MATDIGISAGLTSLPSATQGFGTERLVADFQSSLSAMQVAAPAPSPRATGIGDSARSVTDAIRQLEQEAASLWQPSPGLSVSDQSRTGELGEHGMVHTSSRTYFELMAAAENNLKLSVWAQLFGNVVTKPSEVVSKLTQG